MEGDDDPPALDRHVVIVGMMAAGKTTLGRELAARLGVSYVDSDEAIVDASGASGRELAERQGVESLHQLEADVLIRQLGERPNAVISAAASVVDSVDCRTILRASATVVWIDVPVALLEARINRNDHRRPMAAAEVQSRLDSRSPCFREVSDIRVDGLVPVAGQVDEIIQHLALATGIVDDA